MKATSFEQQFKHLKNIWLSRTSNCMPTAPTEWIVPTTQTELNETEKEATKTGYWYVSDSITFNLLSFWIDGTEKIQTICPSIIVLIVSEPNHFEWKKKIHLFFGMGYRMDMDYNHWSNHLHWIIFQRLSWKIMRYHNRKIFGCNFFFCELKRQTAFSCSCTCFKFFENKNDFIK